MARAKRTQRAEARRRYRTEQALAGKMPNDQNFRAAAEAELAAAKGYKYNSFKIELARRTIIQALGAVAQMG